MKLGVPNGTHGAAATATWKLEGLLRIKVRQHPVARLWPRSKPTRLSRLPGMTAVVVTVMPTLRALFGLSPTARSD